MIRMPKTTKTVVTVKPRKSVTLDLFLERTPDISLNRLQKMRPARMPITGAFSADRIVDIVMDAGIYWTREEAERGMYSMLRSVVKNGGENYGWAPLIVNHQLKGYYIAEAHGHEEELQIEENRA